MKTQVGQSPRAVRVVLAILAGSLATILWVVLRRGDASADRPAAQAATTDAAHSSEYESSPEIAAAQPGPSSSSKIEVTNVPVVVTPATAAAPAGMSAAPAGSASADAAPLGEASSTGGDPDKRRAPRSWRMCFPSAGGAPDAYEIAADDSTASGGSWSARLRSRVDRPNPSGAAICQTIAASDYRGQRISVTLRMRTRDAMPGAHMTFRANAANGQMLAFYNMARAWVQGTTDWAEYSAVLDVPERASAIFVAGTLVNTGTLWIDDAALEIVNRETPVTRPPVDNGPYIQAVDVSRLPASLQNPGFEETVEAPAAR